MIRASRVARQFTHPRAVGWLLPQLLLIISIPAWCSGVEPGGLANGVALTITVQPQDANVPVGRSVTFSVGATGTHPLSYQWRKNGTPVPGATGPSLTIPKVVAADVGTILRVTVGDGHASVTSKAAILTVGPRPPAARDLRFQQVDAPSTAEGLIGGRSYYLEYPHGISFQNTTGTPLRAGAGFCVPNRMQDCAWLFAIAPVPRGVSLSVGYWPNVLDKLDTDLNSISTSSTVITSLDIEPQNDIYAVSWMKGVGDGFDYRHEVVSVGDLSALVANDGTKSRVVTAISIDGSGKASLLSYGWTTDRTTVYETKVLTVSFDGIVAKATSLANAGYIITAFGGNPTDGYILVGTRVQGDSVPRSVLVFPPTSPSTILRGYAMVAQVGDVGNGRDTAVQIYEK